MSVFRWNNTFNLFGFNSQPLEVKQVSGFALMSMPLISPFMITPFVEPVYRAPDPVAKLP